MSRVTAIVVTFDSAEALPACLASLSREGADLLVVDNASGDGSIRVAEAQGASVIALAANEGYGRANNAGVRRAASEFVLICNPDIVLDPGALTALLEAARTYPDAGLYAPRIVEPSGRVFFQPRSLLSAFLPNPKGPLAVPEGDACAPFLSGACFLMRRDLFIEIGGFDERIFLFYEDDDLCRRLSDQGHALVHVHGAVARHGRGRSSAPAKGRAFAARWHQSWSRAYVCEKYGLPSPAFGALVVNGLKAALALVTGRRATIERYAGSAAGAFAWLRGRSAAGRQGLGEAGSGDAV
jgi:N-acetylglucosaminyl-diphospho-decaprenol L-rhamnosyltransferase